MFSTLQAAGLQQRTLSQISVSLQPFLITSVLCVFYLQQPPLLREKVSFCRLDVGSIDLYKKDHKTLSFSLVVIIKKILNLKLTIDKSKI